MDYNSGIISFLLPRYTAVYRDIGDTDIVTSVSKISIVSITQHYKFTFRQPFRQKLM